jgi:polyhydroxybutyrate depolymerase
MILRHLALSIVCIVLVASAPNTVRASHEGRGEARKEPHGTRGVGTPGCGKTPPAAPGKSTKHSIKVGELDREYLLHLPTGYDRKTPTSLVLNIHGYTDTAERWESSTGMSDHADGHGYVVAYPQSTSFRGDLNGMREVTSWNDLACNASPGPDGPTCADDSDPYPCPPECGECGPCNWCTCHDDLGFIDALLDSLESSLCLDRDHIYATGMSNGGMFVHRLGCDRAERFAAIAPVAGTLAKGFNCAPGRSPRISLMHIHGTEDGVVRLDGSRSDDGYLYTPVDEALEAWAGADSQGCAAGTTPYPTPADGKRALRCEQRDDCRSGAEVVSCSWSGEHNWPKAGDDPFGNDVIWEFFLKNSRRP